jgi:hypothetical protein
MAVEGSRGLSFVFGTMIMLVYIDKKEGLSKYLFLDKCLVLCLSVAVE